VDGLRESGVIDGFTVQIDESELIDDAFFNVLVVLETEPSETETVYSSMESSGAQYVMKTADSKILAHFKGNRETFEEHLVGSIPDGVTSYETILVTEEEGNPPTL